MAAVMRAVDALARQFELPPDEARPHAAPQRRWRGMTIGNLHLLIEHEVGGELIDDARVYPLPRCSAVCRGLINLRGQLIPVLDLHRYLDIARPSADRERLLVLGSDAHAVAIGIDALPYSLTLTDTARVQPAALPQRLRAFVTRAYRSGEALWLEFRHREFFRHVAASIIS